MPIKISRLHHAGFLVTDINRATEFYEKVFGFPLLERPDFGFDGRWYDLGNGNQLHLMCIDNLPAHETGNPKFDRHIAIEVPDVQAVAEQLRVLKIEFSQSSGRGGEQIFLRDPDGNMIELRK